MQFSIIIPVYKVEEFLEKCIDSVLNQTFTDFEVILVDDGSPDGSGQICDAYEKKDQRVRVIHKPNGGLVSARKVGIFAAKGDYITYVDGDDWIKPNLLQFVHDRIAESSAPVDMVIFGAEKIFSDHKIPMINKIEEGWYNKERLEKEIYPYLLVNRQKGFEGHILQAHLWNKPCRRELQQEHYVRDEQIRMFTDVPATYEMLLNCNNVYICNEPLYMYNQMNQGSILTLGKMNFLTDSFSHLVAYLQERMRGYYASMDMQLNYYPIHLIIQTAKWRVRTEPSFSQAVKIVKAGLKQTGMLRYVHIKGLPIIQGILALLFKMHLYTPAMIMCAYKERRDVKKHK